MTFADYQAFRVALQWLIEGDELTNTFSVAVLDLIVGMAEGRIYDGDGMTAGLRASTMEADLSAAITDNAADLPADLLQLKEVYFDGKPALQILPLDRMRALEADGASGGADSLFCAQAGDTLRFWPEASGTALGTYYKRPESIVTVTWAEATTFARYPQLFLYACLYEAALFLGMNEKMPLWESRYRQLADGANHSEAMRVYGGGPLRIRVR